MSHKGLHRRLGLRHRGKASQTLHRRPCPRGSHFLGQQEPGGAGESLAQYINIFNE